MTRLIRGTQEDVESAIDLGRAQSTIDKLLDVLEAENLNEDEALWTAVLFFLTVFDATDEFANAELLNAAARGLVREATDVFASLPKGDEDAEGNNSGEADGGDATEGDGEVDEEVRAV